MVFRVDSAAPARGRQKSRRGRGYAPVLRERLPTPEPLGNAGADGLWGQLSCTGSGTAKVASRARIRPMLRERSPTPEPPVIAGGAGSGQLNCTGSGTAKVASRARIRPMLRERSPTPEPSVIAGGADRSEGISGRGQTWRLGTVSSRRFAAARPKSPPGSRPPRRSAGPGPCEWPRRRAA